MQSLNNIIRFAILTDFYCYYLSEMLQDTAFVGKRSPVEGPYLSLRNHFLRRHANRLFTSP